jgi:hypothetical protein
MRVMAAGFLMCCAAIHSNKALDGVIDDLSRDAARKRARAGRRTRVAY